MSDTPPPQSQPARAPQSRTLKTHARLIEAAQDIVARGGFEALRIEEVVQQAGVAKGTFFAHFKDKDALMDLLIGEKLDRSLDPLEGLARAEDLADLVERMMPSIEVIASERYVFDVVVRLSGSLAKEEIGAISQALYRQTSLLTAVIGNSPFRRDAAPDLLAEGVQALITNAIALRFCAMHNTLGLRERLTAYLQTWLCPR